jgi:hypothetical protein
MKLKLTFAHKPTAELSAVIKKLKKNYDVEVSHDIGDLGTTFNLQEGQIFIEKFNDEGQRTDILINNDLSDI